MPVRVTPEAAHSIAASCAFRHTDTEPMRLRHSGGPPGRRVSIMDEPRIVVLNGITSVYRLAHEALSAGVSLAAGAERHASTDSLEYDPVYSGQYEIGRAS